MLIANIATIRRRSPEGSLREAGSGKSVAERRKPNPVSTLRWTTIIPLAPSLLTGSSSLPGDVERAVRCPVLRRNVSPYLALLRAGFCLPPMLPPARCALTAPFHPYSPPRLAALRRSGIFSVPLSFELPRPGVTRRTALRSSDFPPSAYALAGFGETAIIWRSATFYYRTIFVAQGFSPAS